ncbi:Protein LACT-2 [Aphelenchoides avenae]|nr:Protein LACT-2 [Aphelenchus avenae]
MVVDHNIFGYCSPEFVKVEKVFRRIFADGWEREGSSIAVYHRGKLVVDLCGGYADRSCLRKWTPDTKTVVFSATKAVAALCAAKLVDQGHLRYEDKVAKFWPEFGANGKEAITVGWIMTHKAGLAAFDEPITFEDAKDPERMARLIERQRPNWTPGTRSGYHALTYGWLVDQIVRRTDPKKRSVSQFLREEICDANGK